MKFERLIETPALLSAVREQGWETPTAIQNKAIPLIAAGRDVVGVAQTGTGKTGAFVLPTLERLLGNTGLRVLVMCPTRELTQQVAEDTEALAAHTDLRVATIYGGVRIKPQIQRLKEGVDIVVGTPGRLIDHLRRGTLDLSDVEVLILDEADRMLDMGFRPQIEEVLSGVPRDRQTLLFSATMPNGVHALALRYLKDAEWVEATPEIMAAETVEHLVYSVRPDRKVDLLLELLDGPEIEQALVFTRTRSGADLLFARLRGAGINTAVIHGDRNQKERDQALGRFADADVRVLVATDVAQRGLDIEGISHVINFDVPQDPEDYVHRIGRTGRAGAAGIAITFMTAADLAHIHSIERVLEQKIERVSLDGFDYKGGTPGRQRKRARSNRSGRRMGARSTDELSPEELEELLGMG